MKQVCRYCGKDISFMRKGSKYCRGRECYLRRKKEEYQKGRKIMKLKCEQCGKGFKRVNWVQKYCSKECRTIAYGEASKTLATHKQPKTPRVVLRDDDWNHARYMAEQRVIKNNKRMCLTCGDPTNGVDYYCSRHHRAINAIANVCLDWDGGDTPRRAFLR
jgi:hypothetical protein